MGSVGLNRGREELAIDPASPPTRAGHIGPADKSLREGMALDVEKISEADGDTRPSGRIPL